MMILMMMMMMLMMRLVQAPKQLFNSAVGHIFLIYEYLLARLFNTQKGIFHHEIDFS